LTLESAVRILAAMISKAAMAWWRSNLKEWVAG
jgi:hypothetical protein